MSQVLQTRRFAGAKAAELPTDMIFIEATRGTCSWICVWQPRPAGHQVAAISLKGGFRNTEIPHYFHRVPEKSLVQHVPILTAGELAIAFLPWLLSSTVRWGTKKYHFTCTPVGAFPLTNVKTSLIFSDKNVNKETGWPRGSVIDTEPFTSVLWAEHHFPLMHILWLVRRELVVRASVSCVCFRKPHDLGLISLFVGSPHRGAVMNWYLLCRDKTH